MPRTIRPYQPDDLDAVLAAWASASAVGHPFLSDDFMAQERQNMTTRYLPNAETWVITEDGQVIGFISLLGNEVGGLFVHADYHGTGAGRALLDKARALYGDLHLEVFEKNDVGRRFYEKYGFVFVRKAINNDTGEMAHWLHYTDET